MEKKKKNKLHDDGFGCAPLGKQGNEWNDVCIRDHQRPLMAAIQHSQLGRRQPMDWRAEGSKKNLKDEKTSRKLWVVRRLECNNKGKISIYVHICMCLFKGNVLILLWWIPIWFLCPDVNTCRSSPPPPRQREHPRATSWTSAFYQRFHSAADRWRDYPTFGVLLLPLQSVTNALGPRETS